MTTKFLLGGLAKSDTEFIVARLNPITTPEDNTFTAALTGSNSDKKSMWDYCNHDWDSKKLATVEHDGFLPNGITPVNPVVIFIEHKD